MPKRHATDMVTRDSGNKQCGNTYFPKFPNFTQANIKWMHTQVQQTMLDRGHEPLVLDRGRETLVIISVARVLACEGSAVRCHLWINAKQGP
jgi:hypothetical protein